MAFDLSQMTQFDLQFGTGGPGMNPYSARGLRGRLTPIAMAQGDDKGAYSINGKFVDLSAPQFRKLRLEVTGNDQEPPALDGLWFGMPVGVSCLNEVAYLTTGSLSPQRTPVDGSVRTSGNYTIYRPFLQMAIVSWSIDRAEWEAGNTWQLALTEL